MKKRMSIDETIANGAIVNISAVLLKKQKTNDDSMEDSVLRAYQVHDIPRLNRPTSVLKYECKRNGFARTGYRTMLIIRLDQGDTGKSVLKQRDIIPVVVKADLIPHFNERLLAPIYGCGDQRLLALPHDIIRAHIFACVSDNDLFSLLSVCKFLYMDALNAIKHRLVVEFPKYPHYATPMALHFTTLFWGIDKLTTQMMLSFLKKSFGLTDVRIRNAIGATRDIVGKWSRCKRLVELLVFNRDLTIESVKDIFANKERVKNLRIAEKEQLMATSADRLETVNDALFDRGLPRLFSFVDTNRYKSASVQPNQATSLAFNLLPETASFEHLAAKYILKGAPTAFVGLLNGTGPESCARLLENQLMIKCIWSLCFSLDKNVLLNLHWFRFKYDWHQVFQKKLILGKYAVSDLEILSITRYMFKRQVEWGNPSRPPYPIVFVIVTGLPDEKLSIQSYEPETIILGFVRAICTLPEYDTDQLDRRMYSNAFEKENDVSLPLNLHELAKTFKSDHFIKAQPTIIYISHVPRSK